jgi:signal transduction histidine kinase
MTEFKYWVAIVTLLIICILALILMIAHQSKQIKKTELILYRLEEKEKKLKLKTEKEE